VHSFTSHFFKMLCAKNYQNRPMLHGVIKKIWHVFLLRHGDILHLSVSVLYIVVTSDLFRMVYSRPLRTMLQ